MQAEESRGETSPDDAVARYGLLRALFVEDVPEEIELAVHELQRNGITCVHHRVERNSSCGQRCALPVTPRLTFHSYSWAAERRRQYQQIARLTRVLRMLSGINSVIVRLRERTELLEEACRLAVSVGRYSSALVMLRQPGTALLEEHAGDGAIALGAHGAPR